jgi:CRISPR-associated protein Cas2
MLELHPGVFVSMDLDSGSRDRVWSVLESWWQAEPRGTVCMIWKSQARPAGIDFRNLGAPRRNIVEYDGHWALSREVEEGSKT